MTVVRCSDAQNSSDIGLTDRPGPVPQSADDARREDWERKLVGGAS